VGTGFKISYNKVTERSPKDSVNDNDQVFLLLPTAKFPSIPLWPVSTSPTRLSLFNIITKLTPGTST